jgi:hypothetical protein
MVAPVTREASQSDMMVTLSVIESSLPFLVILSRLAWIFGEYGIMNLECSSSLLLLVIKGMYAYQYSTSYLSHIRQLPNTFRLLVAPRY